MDPEVVKGDEWESGRDKEWEWQTEHNRWIETNKARDVQDISAHTLWITGRGQKKMRKWRKVVLHWHHTHLHKHKHTHSLICQSNKERQARATFAWQTGPARLIEEKTILGDRLTVWCGACHLWVGLRTHNRSVCACRWLTDLFVSMCAWLFEALGGS